MALEAQLKKIEKAFTALKAEAMLAKLSPKKRRKRIKELKHQEKQAKEELKKEYESLQMTLKEAKDYADMLDIDVRDALLVLAYREIQRLHWDFHQKKQ